MLNTRLTFSLRCLASQFVNINGFNCRGVSTKEAGTDKAALYSFDDVEEEEEKKAREQAIEEKRNKSGLFPSDYNRQHGRAPYEKPMYEIHETLRYKRRLYGKFGEASNVDPSILWPDKTELAAMREYEEAAQPFTLQQLIKRNYDKKALTEEKFRKAEAEVLEKVSRVNEEIIAFHKRVAAQKAKAMAVLEQKNKLVEQVRKHFGYKLDPRDEKFKQMLDKLQKEEKKKAKADKKAQKEQRILARTSDEKKEDAIEETTEDVKEN